MATVCETNLGMFPADDGTPEPSEVEVGIKLELVCLGRGHASNVDDWGLRFVKAKDPGDVFTCGNCESETYGRELGHCEMGRGCDGAIRLPVTWGCE
jgi:hypothetical protein